MKKIKISLIVLLSTSCLALCALLVFLFLDNLSDKSVVVLSGKEEAVSSEIIPDTYIDDIQEEEEVKLLAIGDNLIHMGVHLTGLQDDGTYDYSFLFENIKPYLDDADIKIINQETILGGNERGDNGYKGYPGFNSRTEIGDAIADAGFNVVLQSTNHTIDQGLDGLLHCAAFWEDNYPDITVCGIRQKADTNPPIQTMEIKGITFAFLNYTYGPNMESFPAKYEGYMDILCDYNETTRIIDFTTIHPKVLEIIEEADKLADVVVVCTHWGTEYATKQSSYQEKFAMQMTEAGADLIIGTHPHVVQPVSYVESENGNKSLCYYSLGNYVSTQKQVKCMLEGMAIVTFVKHSDGTVCIKEENTGVIPMVCQYTQGSVRIDNIYFLDEYTEELAQKHGMYTYAGIPFHLSDMTDLSEEVFGEWAMKPYLNVIDVDS